MGHGYRWHTDTRKCSHGNDDVCPFCDFDGYYAATYEDCPWRDQVACVEMRTEAAPSDNDRCSE